ncbi:transmembrane protein 119b [Trichomycterus rosablanca]|uniref:transmembrane protein 119b n=1 Tax=Trichomycterus rosablanca TaxID=2290929 RepID=UPI002F35062A
MMEEASGVKEFDKHELTYSTSVSLYSQDPLGPTSVYTEGEETTTEHNLLKEVLGFLQENLFLILVITGLIIIIFLLICSAVVLSRRRKVSAYYPCAFPAKMYVNESDKTGGARIFCEVPEKPPSSSMEEPTNRAKRLQEDILLATKNLRTPTKCPWKEDKTKLSKPKSAEQAEQEKENSRMAEEKNPEQCVTEEAEEEISSGTSQDTAPVGHMEKSDPSKSETALENEHPSGSNNLETHEEKDKQEVVAPGLSFISEEKTAF